eukprot:7475351-Alexandrium_andersonii.AAC.1
MRYSGSAVAPSSSMGMSSASASVKAESWFCGHAMQHKPAVGHAGWRKGARAGCRESLRYNDGLRGSPGKA